MRGERNITPSAQLVGCHVPVLIGHAYNRGKGPGGVAYKRIRKVLWPYLIWSAAYLLVMRPSGDLEAVWALLTGGAAAQMYYLLVYAQLSILTPLLYRLLRRYRAALYAVTPCVLVIWQLFALFQVDAPKVGVLFPTWLIYYLFGLEWEKWHERLEDHRRAVAVTALLSIVVQCAEGLMWFGLGNYSMATTQLRITNMVSALAVIAAFMLVSGSVRNWLRACLPLVRLGNVSFGVYLCHIAALMVARKVFMAVGLLGLFPSLFMWALVLFVSAMAVVLCQQILPKRALQLLGLG